MSEPKRIEMTIGHTKIALVGDESAEYLRSLGAYLNRRIAELQQSPAMQNLSPDMLYILLAINLTDDYSKLRARHQRLGQAFRRQQEELQQLRAQLEEWEANQEAAVPAAPDAEALSAEEPPENQPPAALEEDAQAREPGPAEPAGPSESPAPAETPWEEPPPEALPGDRPPWEEPEPDAAPEEPAPPEPPEEPEAEVAAAPTRLKPVENPDLGRRYLQQAGRISALNAENEDLKHKLAQLKALVGQLESRERPVDTAELQDENLALRRENDALREKLERMEESDD